MATPDPRRGDEPDLEDSDLPELNGSAPQPDDDLAAGDINDPDNDGPPRGQHRPGSD